MIARPIVRVLGAAASRSLPLSMVRRRSSGRSTAASRPSSQSRRPRGGRPGDAAPGAQGRHRRVRSGHRWRDHASPSVSAADQSQPHQGHRRDGADRARRGMRRARQELHDEVARGYASAFTEQDLKDLLDFYKTPLGKKIIESEPKAGEAIHQARAGVDREICRRSDGQNARGDEEEGPQRILSRRSRALTGQMAMPEEVDLFVIGAGSGGVRAARIASGYGARVMIAEEYRVGGTCVIRGCVPKKLLVYASRFADEFEDAAGFGWTVPRAEVRLGDADRQQGPARSPGWRAAYTANLERAKVDDRQEPRGAGRSAHRQAHRDRRDRARQAHPDRDRRLRPRSARTSKATSTSSRRTKRFISRNCRSAS